ncbi:TfoX/Sxy family protein [Candidatus Bipolaricaulota bacterium]|nr:TfoX/Sxy family protein [Candidatus Bipolaricaulota bacterium]
MTYSEDLDGRIATCIAAWDTFRRKMFGGTCYLLDGRMMCGVYKDFLILRLGEQGASRAMSSPSVHPFDITGRPMKGWVMVEESVVIEDRLCRWLEEARAFVETLPSKTT